MLTWRNSSVNNLMLCTKGKVHYINQEKISRITTNMLECGLGKLVWFWLKFWWVKDKKLKKRVVAIMVCVNKLLATTTTIIV